MKVQYSESSFLTSFTSKIILFAFKFTLSTFWILHLWLMILEQLDKFWKLSFIYFDILRIYYFFNQLAITRRNNIKLFIDRLTIFMCHLSYFSILYYISISIKRFALLIFYAWKLQGDYLLIILTIFCTSHQHLA